MVAHAGRRLTLKDRAGTSEPLCFSFWCRAGRQHGALLAGLTTSRENYSNFIFLSDA
jgi:hypothetical protein